MIEIENYEITRIANGEFPKTMMALEGGAA